VQIGDGKCEVTLIAIREGDAAFDIREGDATFDNVRNCSPPRLESENSNEPSPSKGKGIKSHTS
jgi:hypothetical protein